MNRLRTLFVTVFLASGMVLATACYNPSSRRSSRYLIPEGYVGWVRIDFKVQSAPQLPIEDGFYLCKIPPSGLLQTSSDIEYGTAKDESYYYSDGGRRPPKGTGAERDGTNWGFTGHRPGDDGAYEYFFVGTDSELKEFGWKERDALGVNPKVGPIKPLPASNNSLQRSAK